MTPHTRRAITVILPDQPPAITPTLAAALLRLLHNMEAARTTRHAPTDKPPDADTKVA